MDNAYHAIYNVCDMQCAIYMEHVHFPFMQCAFHNVYVKVYGVILVWKYIRHIPALVIWIFSLLQFKKKYWNDDDDNGDDDDNVDDNDDDNDNGGDNGGDDDNQQGEEQWRREGPYLS